MIGKRYTEEFKKEAIKQMTELGYSVADVSQRLGTTTHSVYAWLKKFGESNPRLSDTTDVEAERDKTIDRHLVIRSLMMAVWQR